MHTYSGAQGGLHSPSVVVLVVDVGPTVVDGPTEVEPVDDPVPDSVPPSSMGMVRPHPAISATRENPARIRMAPRVASGHWCKPPNRLG